MRSLNVLFFLAFVGVLASAQSAQLRPSVRSAKKALIENTSGDPSLVDSVHLILASSHLSWTDDLDKADLILKFSSRASAETPSVRGQEISIAVKNFYTLPVVDKSGTVVWRDEIEFDPSSNVRKDRTEQSWIAYLHKHPAAKLLTHFLTIAN